MPIQSKDQPQGDLKVFFEKIYSDKRDMACLYLPILKVIIDGQQWSREKIEKKLDDEYQTKGKWGRATPERGALALDHLWSQRFGKGQDRLLLNELVSHDGDGHGKPKTWYQMKGQAIGNVKKLIKDIRISKEQETSLINSRLASAQLKPKAALGKQDPKPDSEKGSKPSMQYQPLNQILYGPPGTGKTWSLILKAMEIINKQSFENVTPDSYQTCKKAFEKARTNGKIAFVTFHQSYGYEDFVIGIKPRSKDGAVTYEVEDGILRRIAIKAQAAFNEAKEGVDAERFVLIIDEINRGNISKIFGELITLVEEDKRIGNSHAMQIELPCRRDPNKPENFGLPKNLYIIGTMNTADRSLAQLDIALRRRFDFVPMMPNPDVLENLKIDGVDVAEMLKSINSRIEALYDRDHTIGHAYFTSLMAEGKELADLAHIFRNRIIPLLEEYFFEDWGKIRLVLGDNQKETKLQFVQIVENKNQSLFGDGEEANAYSNDTKKRYVINEDAFQNTKSYQMIYTASQSDSENSTVSAE